MTNYDRYVLAEEMYIFWRKREHVIYLTGNLHGKSPEEIRLWFCEVASVYMDHLRRKMKKGYKEDAMGNKS